MRILDRYIGITVGTGILVAMLVLVALDSFFELVKELDDIGRGEYTFLEALFYILLTLPHRVYELFPMAVVLGSITGLGVLASNSELTVLRASGVSLMRIMFSAMKAGLLVMVAVVFVGEIIAPASEQYANNRRSLKLSDQITLKSRYGFWARDGLSYVNIRSVKPGGNIGDIYIFEFDEEHRLRVATFAREAIYQEDRWLLRRIQQSHISTKKVENHRIARAEWDSLLSPGLVNVVVVNPRRLSALDLYRYIRYLHENAQDADRYELELWLKLLVPFSTAVMMLLAVPFVFGPLRSVGVGQRILVGFLVGFAYYLLNQTVSHLGLAYELSPLLSAVATTVVFFVLSLVLIRRVR